MNKIFRKKPAKEDLRGVLTIVSERGFEVQQFEVSQFFGNVVLIVSRNDVYLRFVRDRGFTTCEIMSRDNSDHWQDYDLTVRDISVDSYSFCDVVQKVLSFYSRGIK